MDTASSVHIYALISHLMNELFFRHKVNAFEMNGSVQFTLSDLNKIIPYRYMVYSTFPNSASSWEHIHDLPSNGTFYRCLELKQSSPTGKEHRYRM